MSLDPLKLYNILKDKDISFFTGVPDSLLKQFVYALMIKLKVKTISLVQTKVIL